MTVVEVRAHVAITAPDSPWRQRLADDAPLDDAATPGARAQLVQEGRWNPYMNSAQWTCPITYVDRSTPLRRVYLTNLNSALNPLRQAMLEVPIPDDIYLPTDSDSEVCIVDPTRDRTWDFWKFHPTTQAGFDYQAAYGGRMSLLSRNPGHYVDRKFGAPSGQLPADPRQAALYEDRSWGAFATSIPIAATILRRSDVDAGVRDMALGWVPVNARSGTFWPPAQRTDGQTPGGGLVEGMKLRLPPSWVPPAGMHPITRIVGAALRDYGWIVVDKTSSSPSMRAEPAVTGSRLWTHGYDVFPGFPWDQIVVVAP